VVVDGAKARDIRLYRTPGRGRILGLMAAMRRGAMQRSTRSGIAWVLWMTGGGVAISIVVWVLTGSVGWL
jgi:hypothetical protein